MFAENPTGARGYAGPGDNEEGDVEQGPSRPAE